MIIFNNLILSEVPVNKKVKNWIVKAILNENLKEGEVNYIFCDDIILSELNIKYLKHNTLTDIISFDYTIGKIISGDIFISIERVKENAELFNTKYVDELHRVMIHGVLHYCGYKDKTDEEKTQMRSKEDYYLSLRDF
ncbi:MAG: rRNA maturation RNase YbeY [Zetaproteobacteria bacterium]|nr:rRNA maturation RNase YbeY [Flavobacteriales bacterium]